MGAWVQRCTALAVVFLAACGGGGGGGADAASESSGKAETASAESRAEGLILKDPAVASKVDRRLLRARGAVSVWVTLDDAPVSTVAADRMAAQGIAMKPRTQIASAGTTASREATAVSAMRSELLAHRQALSDKQAVLAGQMQTVGAQELGRVQLAANAIAVKVDADAVPKIAQMTGVAKIRPVVDVAYEPKTRGRKQEPKTAAPSSYTGKGVRIAVLDSGIDYTHYNLGGPGTVDAYEAAISDATLRNRLFPTAKVVDGYDFVGDYWPDFDLMPDSDPIDLQGHGTHVADIAAGLSADGLHRGVAPDAKLLAIKVCSSVATSCSGVAILQGLDFALDPNRDGDISDAVDIVNMSLGASYGQQEDDSWVAVSRLERLGVVVVVAAGNDGNKPYVVSSPSTTPGAISVAQTTMPYDVAIPLIVNAPASLKGRYPNTALMDWAPIDRTVTADLAYVGTGCPEDPVYPVPVTGRIALIDRGTCTISAKVDRAARSGAVGVVIGLIADGDAVSFSLGDGTQFVPSIVITKDVADRLKAALANGTRVNATLSPDAAINVAGSMASTSARGPSYSKQTIKPEIGAPGATVSALVGSGSDNEGFGGTSGATPVVAGSAALMIQAFPTLLPEQIKAMLMNSAEREIYIDKAREPGVLAPITRIGAGEVRPLRALALRSIARVEDARSAALSFGLVDASRNRTLSQKLLVENLSSSAKTYRLKSSFRYAADDNGAVRVSLPSSVTVPARGRTEVPVTLRIDASKLPAWNLNGGADGGRGELLEDVEFDGYVELTAGSESLTVPWHVLPRRAADLGASARTVAPGSTFSVKNTGAGVGGYDVFALTGTNSNDGEDALPGSNRALIDLRAVGVRVVGDYLQFAINTYGRRAHPVYPAEFDIYVDVDGDQWEDLVLFNAENGGFGATGQDVVWLIDFRTGDILPVSYVDADLNSANVIYTVPVAALEMTPGVSLTFSVLAFDNYFSGTLTDGLGPMQYSPTSPRYTTDGALGGELATGGQVTLKARARAGGSAASPSQDGFLVMYRNDRDNEADIVRVR